MNRRIEKLKEGIRPEKYPLCIEKSRLWTESYKETEGEPETLRRAKALANILDKITIFIEDGELIVGNGASKPMGSEITYWGGTWYQEEIDGLKEEGYTISEEDEAEVRSLNEYWEDKTFRERQELLLDEERLWPFMQSGINLPPWTKERGPGGGWAEGGMGLGPSPLLYTVDYAEVLNGGLNRIVEEAEQELRTTRIMSADAVKKTYYLKAVIIAHKAVIRFAHRYAVLAAELADKETDPSRKKELERIAATCLRVPGNPARDFREAMQFFWFLYLMLQPSLAGAGRFDQYMYPFYRKDIEGGKITEEEVLELLQCLRIKDMALNTTSARGQREKWAGMAKWHNWVIGGQTPDGEDTTNELSFLILEAARRCQTPHHTITMRVHEGTPESLMLKALEVVKTGIGMPAFVGDKSYIEYMLTQGVPLEKARDYVVAGCIDATLPGQSRIVAFSMFVMALVFEIFMHNGVEPRTGRQLGPKTGELESFETFDDLMKAFKEQLAYFLGLQAENNNILVQVTGEIAPRPFESSLMMNGIKEGKDLLDRTFPLENVAVVNAVGMINVADSLAAIKKLVFDENKVTMRKLKAALAANWQGNGYAEMRKMCLTAPKYGNDDDYVDSIARELYRFSADTIATLDTVLGGKHKPSAISISAQWPGGALTGATPDGRYAGECLADGAVSAMRGRDTHGPIAVIKSASKIDQVPYSSALMNMKFHPSALNTTEDMRKLSALIRTYFAMNGSHIQFNIVNRETLLEAQEHPENYPDLIVRVAGYSAYFVQLGKAVQDEVIGRTEHELA